MPWASPSLKELVDLCSGELSARLLDGAPLKPSSVMSVYAATRAGGEFNMYGFMAWAFKQIFVDSAETEFLDRWAAVWGVQRKAAKAASGLVTVTGTAGTGVPEGAMAKDASGNLYSLSGTIIQPPVTPPETPEGEDPAPVPPPSGECEAEAQEPGKKGNLKAGAKLNLVSPIAGIDNTLTAGEKGITGGVDTEDDEAFRARLLVIIQNPPHGGNKADYETWALSVEGVEGALCVPTYNGLGTVAVLVWGKPEDPVLPDNIVKDAYDTILALCPVTAGPGLLVTTPDILPVDFIVHLDPDREDVRQNMEKDLADLFKREAVPGKVIPLSHISEAISLTPGEYDHILIAPAANIMPGFKELPVIGAVTYE